jgi:hypothetical protein
VDRGADFRPASRRLDLLDREHLVELLTDITKREYRALTSRRIVLLLHLLKIREQPDGVSKSWNRTIRTQQREIELMPTFTPSLRRQAESFAAEAYPIAVHDASLETGLPAARFPPSSPWTVAEALAFEPPPPVTVNWRRR